MAERQQKNKPSKTKFGKRAGAFLLIVSSQRVALSSVVHSGESTGTRIATFAVYEGSLGLLGLALRMSTRSKRNAAQPVPELSSAELDELDEDLLNTMPPFTERAMQEADPTELSGDDYDNTMSHSSDMSYHLPGGSLEVKSGTYTIDGQTFFVHSRYS